MNKFTYPSVITRSQALSVRTTTAIETSTAVRTGAMLPLLAVVMVILLIAAVFSIDIAYVHVCRSELRTATDAAARAAIEALGREQNEEAAIDAALEIARQNRVAGIGLELDRSSIVFGTAQPDSDNAFVFIPGGGGIGRPVNAVRVTGGRTSGSPNGPVSMLFGPLFGVTEFQPIQTAVAARSDRDIALVLDVSGSMNQFGRMVGLRNAVRIFLAELGSQQQDIRVSLTVYSTNGRKVANLTNDLDFINSEFSQIPAAGWTAIGEGLQIGLDSLLNDPQRRIFAQRSILLMTDGFHNRGIHPLPIADQCADAGVLVNTVTFSREANQSLMIQVAERTDGIHFHAVSNEQLEEVFRELARQMKVLLIE